MYILQKLCFAILYWVTRWKPLLEQELLTLPKHLGSPPVFSGVRVTRSLVLCVCFVDCCLSSFFWSLCCLSFLDLWLLTTLPVSSNLLEYRKNVNRNINILILKWYVLTFLYFHTWNLDVGDSSQDSTYIDLSNMSQVVDI